MKTLLFTTIFTACLAARVYGQSIAVDNTLNTNFSPIATSGGLVWTNANNQVGLFDGFDYNLGIELYAGPSSNSLTYIATFFPGDTNGTVYTGSDYGYFQRSPFSTSYNTGVPPGNMAWVELRMWWWEIGPYSTYLQAVSNGVPACDVVFQNPTSNPGGTPPVWSQTLTGMPAAVLSIGCTAQTTSISQQPTDQIAPQGTTVTFSVAASGAAGFQWLFNGGALVGATASTLVLTNVQPTNAGSYSVVVFGCPYVTSSNAVLTVICESPTITQQPTNQSVAAGSLATLSVVADWAYGYQWLFNGTNISGATGSTLALANAQLANAGAYSVIVYGCAGTSTTSSNALLTVDCESPTFTKQPTSQGVAAGFTATFSVAADWAFGFQWLFNGTNIPGAITSTLLVPNVNVNSAGLYSVVVYGCSNNVTSSNALLTVLTSPYPLSANQRGTVTCYENPAITYDIYLPPAYSTNGPPLPILYTMDPSGGGMVSEFQNVCSTMNIIVVGLTGSRNSWTWNPVLREMYAVPRDVRRRVFFDPTAEFVSGLSGGGENCYIFSRFWSQHVAGLLPMAGWLGNVNDNGNHVPYFSTDRVQTNLLVARTTGNTDTGALFYDQYDSNYLASCGAVVKDWIFSGGHTSAPDYVKQPALSWLLTNRVPAGVYDQSNSAVQELNWRARIASGDRESVLRECVSTLMSQPRTWFSQRAQLVLDDLMTDYNSFQTLNVSNIYSASSTFITNALCMTNGPVFDSVHAVELTSFVGVNYWSQSDFASDLFYYYAHGAATNNDRQQYNSALKVLTGIPNVNGDRAGDLNYILNKFKYPGPQVQLWRDPIGSQIDLHLSKNVPGLSYSVQARTNLTTDTWQNTSPSTAANDTDWTAYIPFDSAQAGVFFRLTTTPLPGTSPPWPDDGGIGF